jgi:DNA polymerase I-like protein with 3'-5' exonuclease and polymerase domains
VADGTSSRTLRNFQLQAGGGDILRVAIIGLHAAGIQVVAPVHDAVLIEAAAEDIEAHVAAAKEIMEAAARVVTGGFPIRVDKKIFGPGERYYDPRGTPMWNRIVRCLRAESRPGPEALAA